MPAYCLYILSDKVKTLLELADGLLSKMLDWTGWSGLETP